MYRAKEEGKERDREKFKEDSSASGHDEPWIQWYVLSELRLFAYVVASRARMIIMVVSC
jgi:hypothetical protein